MHLVLYIQTFSNESSCATFHRSPSTNSSNERDQPLSDESYTVEELQIIDSGFIGAVKERNAILQEKRPQRPHQRSCPHKAQCWSFDIEIIRHRSWYMNVWKTQIMNGEPECFQFLHQSRCDLLLQQSDSSV